MENLKQSGYVGVVTPTTKPRPVNDQEQSKREQPKQQRRRKPDPDDDHKIDEYA